MANIIKSQPTTTIIIDTMTRWNSQIPENTIRAYRYDVKQFREYCDDRGLDVATMTPGQAREYVAYLAAQYKPTTVARKIAAVRSQLTRFMESANITRSNPFDTMAVKDAITATRRDAALNGIGKDKATAAGYNDVLFAFKNMEHSTRTIDHRDRVMLVLGFLGGFRRSELAKLTWSDVELVSDGFRIKIWTSKTNQDGGKAEYKHFFHGSGSTSIPALMEIWRFVVGDKSEYIFPTITKGGKIENRPLSEKGINRVVKKRLGNDYSGHSLRRGFITESFNRGASLTDIVHQTGQSPQTVQRDYLNELEKGKHNAARLF